MSERVEIKGAGLSQVHRSLRTGKRVLVTDDVQNIARDLREIDESLKLEYDPGEDIWVVMQTVVERDGSISDKLVTTWSNVENGTLDQRLVQRVREIAHPGYDLAAELEKQNKVADRRREQNFEEKVGAAAEHLAFALRKDLGMKPRAFVPAGTKGA